MEGSKSHRRHFDCRAILGRRNRFTFGNPMQGPTRLTHIHSVPLQDCDGMCSLLARAYPSAWGDHTDQARRLWPSWCVAAMSKVKARFRSIEQDYVARHCFNDDRITIYSAAPAQGNHTLKEASESCEAFRSSSATLYLLPRLVSQSWPRNTAGLKTLKMNTAIVTRAASKT